MAVNAQTEAGNPPSRTLQECCRKAGGGRIQANSSGQWRHGDFFKVNRRGGCYIYGRSDSTLNRAGVRMGTAEIYRIVENVEGVQDSLVLNFDLPAGRFFMPMFVVSKPGFTLDEAMQSRITSILLPACLGAAASTGAATGATGAAAIGASTTGCGPLVVLTVGCGPVGVLSVGCGPVGVLATWTGRTWTGGVVGGALAWTTGSAGRAGSTGRGLTSVCGPMWL